MTTSLLALASWLVASGLSIGTASAPPAGDRPGDYGMAPDRLGPGTVTLVPAEGGPPVPHPTIQAAVDAAREGDTVLLSEGLFVGAGNRGVVVEGKNVTIQSASGPRRSVIDCEGEARGFLFTGSAVTADTLLRGVTIRRGNASGSPVTEFGGGIVVAFGSTATIEDCVVTSCVASNAGGIAYFAPADELGRIRDCRIENNSSNAVGGGLTVSNTIVERCTIVGNRAVTTGGGIAANDQGVIRDSLVARNAVGPSSSRGAGIIVYDSDHLVENCTIVENTGAVTGGGLALQFGEVSTVSNCVLWGNTASFQGSQVYLDQLAFLTLDHCTIEDGAAGIATAAGAVPTLVAVDGAAPAFVDASAGDFRLAPGSPAVDAGSPAFVPLVNHGDLDYFPRVANGVVDRGCYESWSGPTLSLISPGRAGETNSIRLEDVDDGALVALFYSDAAGSLDVSFGACPGLTLDLTDPLLLHAQTAGAAGRASYSCFVPGGMSDVGVFLQALTFLSGRGCATSNLVHFAYP